MSSRAWPADERELRRLAWRNGVRLPNWIDLPYREARRYEAAINQEREVLGLRPVGIGYPELWSKDPCAERAAVGIRQVMTDGGQSSPGADTA